MSLNNECKEIQELLSAYLDQESEDESGVESHLSKCVECSNLLQKLSEAKGLLAGLAPSLPQRDFTSELEQKLGKSNSTSNLKSGYFSKTAVAAIFLALAGIIGFFALSKQEKSPSNSSVLVAQIPKQEIQSSNKIVAEQKIPTLQKQIKEEVATTKKKNEAKIQVANNIKQQIKTVQPSISVIEQPINIALNTGDLSSEEGLFNEMGFGSDEDGLYAIKL